jgi:cell fate regulator YaaT (PSP1 superfamily)
LSAGLPEPVAPRPAGPRPVAPERDVQIVQVQFKGLRRDHYAAREEVPLVEGEHVVVEADRGRDLGWVHRAARADELTCGGGCEHAGERPVLPPSRRVLRRAAPVDVERLLELRSNEADVRTRTRGLVEKHGLKMKVSEAEWQWDRNKLTVYFTADKRVDFRALVRDMAGEFRTRIELRQIGVRDEARRLGGIGRCRRELCCRAWLPEIQPVTLQLAKDQGLSLNPAQISGACGRLMSCLHYEHEAYLQARKRFPREGQTLATSRGEETVVAWNLFRETVTLKDEHGERRTVPLEELKREARGRPGGPGRAGRTERA